jgi:glyoxylate reductase
LITTRLPGRVDEILRGHEVAIGPPTPEALARIDALLPLLSVRVDEALLRAAPSLRIVANYAVGYDNVDVPAASRRGVLVTNTPGVLTDATADLTMALLLAAARRFGEADEVARADSWPGWTPDFLCGLELRGATLGIVGFGRIGRAVAERARAFGMRILYAQTRRADAETERALAAEHKPLDALLAEADVVSIHCPLSPATRHLIGARELAAMKPTAILVNTARGPIVDEAALGDALAAGRPGGCGLDVFEDEPSIHPRLRADRRAVLTPHIGSATRTTRARMAETAAQSIADFFDGRRPAHPVNPEVLTSPDRSSK